MGEALIQKSVCPVPLSRGGELAEEGDVKDRGQKEVKSRPS